MSCTAETCDLPLFHLRPPYDGFGHPISHRILRAERFGPGSLLGIGVEAPERALSQLARWVPVLRAERPATPLIVRLGAGSAGPALQVAHRAAHLGIRATLMRGDSVEPTLRPILSHPVDLADDVMAWLELRGVAFGPRMRELTHLIVRNASSSTSLGDLLAEAGVAERTARAWCRKKHLPPPGGWFDVARGLCTALRIQRDVETPLWMLALELGYADHSGVCKHMRRLFRARAGEIRRNLGWEWLLERWTVAWLHPSRPGGRSADRVFVGPVAANTGSLVT